ncbi:restriction endonuclease subunit S [Halobacillus kuroshimensis]|uniref:Restriction endonuclease subunit S n=1 Tax=Halobacillus kuroshimensis TaxID=302481 RepID=A0ABS3DU96_9BACI|nr:restriction endonuclease subunit S [Halobacillus kuroshimensis]MBN8234920.1 restriction endonuclease subunit S [Halobacillus kuroshimensis]
MTNKNMPEVRLDGFSGEWEQCKLAEVAQYSNGGSFENEVVNKGKYELITLKSVDIDGKLVPSNKYINSEVITLKKGTLVMILSEQAPGLLGKTAVIPLDNYYVLNQRVASLTPKEKTDSIFLNKAINRKGKYFSSKGAGTKVQNISKQNVENFEFFAPEFKEQQKIGKFFKSLDDRIALQQRQIELLKESKQGFLQKMFPKDGERVPEVRFDGFSGEWKKCKLEDIVERVQGNDGRMDLPTLTISAEQGWLDQRERFSANIAGKEQKNYTLLSKGELSYNHGNSKLAKYGVIYELKNYEEALVPRVYHSFRPKPDSDSSFIEYMFATKRPDRELAKLVTSGARMDGLLNINYQAFVGINITVPEYKEQQKIGEFFKKLDDSIATHEKELELLKETKKGFLQKMFV